ncbi:MAG: hypothetical protein V4448_02085 [Pseudomonadota bacterium]
MSTNRKPTKNDKFVQDSFGNIAKPSWQPAMNSVISTNELGAVVSRYCDSVWNLSHQAGKPIVLNFGDGQQRKGASIISKENANVLRRIASWWLKGERKIFAMASISTYFSALRQIFLLCTKENIVATDLYRFPAVCDQIIDHLAVSKMRDVFTLLSILFENRDCLGFVILNGEELKRFGALLSRHQKKQTPYIPLRIWTYQTSRLYLFLSEFSAKKIQIEKCFEHLVSAYIKRYGEGIKPGGNNKALSKVFSSSRFETGKFEEVAREFGIDELLKKWCGKNDQDIEQLILGNFTSFLTYANSVALAYILNHSAMRLSEGWSLRADCLFTESDDVFGQFTYLKGSTSKGMKDDDANWICSPSVETAIEVASCISKLRLKCAIARDDVPVSVEDISNPPLFLPAYEPWAGIINAHQPLSFRRVPPSYKSLIDENPRLFNTEQIKITKQDLQQARLINPDLNGSKYRVGQPWPFAFHQLRRSGAVNMLATDVSVESSQYQMKHRARPTTRYYCRGHSAIRLNGQARAVFIEAAYLMLANEIRLLFNERFVSPYGDERKRQILQLVEPRDHESLVLAAKQGKVNWRETLLGACTKRGACEFGGVENIIRCGGGDGRSPCSDALYDKSKKHQIKEIGKMVDARLEVTPRGSPYHESLTAQKNAVKNVLKAMNEQS